MVRVHYHPRFERLIRQMAAEADHHESQAVIFGEVSALLGALEDYGHEIEGEEPDDPSHRVVSSQYELFALRRTPPTRFTYDARLPPVIRIMYAWCDEADGSESAVVWLMGDKSGLGNPWYDGIVQQIETSMIPEWERRHPERRIRMRRR